MKNIILVLLLTLFLSSCNITFKWSEPVKPVEATDSVRSLAYESALFYVENKVSYLWGGDYYIEPSRSNYGVDCSGLVINNYKYATKDTKYRLPFSDATSHDICFKYSYDIVTPEKGDLIFWINNDGRVYHVALFEKQVGNYYYFIDSTEIPSLGINGVTYRYASITGVYTVKRFKLLE